MSWIAPIVLGALLALGGCRGSDPARGALDLQHADGPDSLRVQIARAEHLAREADSLDVRGDLAVAIDRRVEELRLRRGASGDHDLEVAASLTSLARLYLRAGEVATARAMDQEALEIRTGLLGSRHPLVAQSLAALAWDHKDVTDRSVAKRYFRRALEVQRRALGPGSPGEWDILTGLANLYRVERRADSALVLFEQVETARRRGEAHDDLTLGTLLFDIAMTLGPLGRWEEALPRLEEAITRERRVGPRAHLDLARALGAYGTALRHAGRARDALAPLRESARLFEDLRAGSPPGPRRGGTYSLVSYNLLAAAQLECGEEQEAWRSLERPLARGLVEQLAARGAVDTTGWCRDPLTRVQRALEPDQAIIGWLTVRPGAAREEYPYWCYCIRREGPVRWSRSDRPAIAGTSADAALDESRRELSRAAAWPLRVEDATDIRARNLAAYQARFLPLEPFLSGARRLIVIAPDLAHGSPIAAWVDQEGRWLAERFSFCYAPSALLFAIASERSECAPRTWEALLVEGAAGAGTSRMRLPNLPTEVEAVAACLPGRAERVDAREAMARLRVLAANDSLARYGLLHFASHAAVDPEVHGESALLFAGGDSGPRVTLRDSASVAMPDRLTLSEVEESWRLDAELVTLSACESALGGFWMNDGYFGLPYVCLAAGAHTVLASIWPVDDSATALLMGRFYRLLMAPDFHAGARLADREAAALRDASLWVAGWRAPDGSLPFAHPVYWAGFILMTGGPGTDAAHLTRASLVAAPDRPLATRTK